MHDNDRKHACAQGLPPPTNSGDAMWEEREPSPGAYSRDSRNLLRDFDLACLLCDRPRDFIERMRTLAEGNVVDIPMSQQAGGGGPSKDMILVPTSPADRAKGELSQTLRCGVQVVL